MQLIVDRAGGLGSFCDSDEFLTFPAPPVYPEASSIPTPKAPSAYSVSHRRQSPSNIDLRGAFSTSTGAFFVRQYLIALRGVIFTCTGVLFLRQYSVDRSRITEDGNSSFVIQRSTKPQFNGLRQFDDG